MNNNQPINNQQSVIIRNISNNIEDNKKEAVTIKQKIRKTFIFLIFLGMIIIGVSIYLLVDDNKKYNNYIPMAADLISSEKINKSGIEYYKGTYKYIINKKEYFYQSKKLYSTTPDKIIQIKYNRKDPNKLYDENASKFYFIVLFSGIAFSLISMVIVVALSPSKSKEIITVEVVEQVTCVGGRRIYLSNLQIDNNAPIAYDQKYYVYFTNDLNKFALGNKLTFNIYQYSEVFTTEVYKQKLARVIYEFKNEDFTLIEIPIKKTN